MITSGSQFELLLPVVFNIFSQWATEGFSKHTNQVSESRSFDFAAVGSAGAVGHQINTKLSL